MRERGTWAKERETWEKERETWERERPGGDRAPGERNQERPGARRARTACSWRYELKSSTGPIRMLVASDRLNFIIKGKTISKVCPDPQALEEIQQ